MTEFERWLMDNTSSYDDNPDAIEQRDELIQQTKEQMPTIQPILDRLENERKMKELQKEEEKASVLSFMKTDMTEDRPEVEPTIGTISSDEKEGKIIDISKQQRKRLFDMSLSPEERLSTFIEVDPDTQFEYIQDLIQIYFFAGLGSNRRILQLIAQDSKITPSLRITVCYGLLQTDTNPTASIQMLGKVYYDALRDNTIQTIQMDLMYRDLVVLMASYLYLEKTILGIMDYLLPPNPGCNPKTYHISYQMLMTLDIDVYDLQNQFEFKTGLKSRIGFLCENQSNIEEFYIEIEQRLYTMTQIPSVPSEFGILAASVLLRKNTALCRTNIEIDIDMIETYLVHQMYQSPQTIHGLDFRGDATDTLIRYGSAKNQQLAKDVLLELGDDGLYTTTIYENKQNAHHDSFYLSSILTLKRIMQVEIPPSLFRKDVITSIYEWHDTLCNLNKKDNIENALYRISVDPTKIEDLELTLSELLMRIYVDIEAWPTQIPGNELLEEQDFQIVRDMLRVNLCYELSEMYGTCLTGYVSRLGNVYAGTIACKLYIPYKDQVKVRFAQLLNRNIKALQKFSNLLQCHELMLHENKNENENEEEDWIITDTETSVKSMSHEELIEYGYHSFIQETQDYQDDSYSRNKQNNPEVILYHFHEKINQDDLLYELTLGDISKSKSLNEFLSWRLPFIRHELFLWTPDEITDLEFDEYFKDAYIAYGLL